MANLLRDTWAPLTETVPEGRISRWRTSPTQNLRRFEAFLNGIVGLIETELAAPLRLLELLGTVDEADGVWLDFIGARLGLPRPRTAVIVPRFGFGPAQVPTNAPPAAVPPVQRAGFNQAPFYTRRRIGAVAPISDAVYADLLRARAVAMQTEWCPTEDVVMAAQYAAGLPGQLAGGFVLDPAAPQVSYHMDPEVVAINTDERAVALEVVQENVLLAAAGVSATESQLWRITISPWMKVEVVTLTGVVRGMAPNNATQRWIVLGATLHTLDIDDGTLGAGVAITGLGAGETVRAIASDGTDTYLHTGPQLYSLDTATGAATSVGAALTGNDQVETLTYVGTALYATLADGRYASMASGTGAVTATGDELPDGREGRASCALEYANNEGDARVAVIDGMGETHFYDPVIAAATLQYAVYLGGNHARITQDLIMASEDRADEDVANVVILPRPAGVRGFVRII